MLTVIPYPCKCMKCGHTFTYLQYSGGFVNKPREQKSITCPNCGSTKCSIVRGCIEKIKGIFK